MVTTNELRLRTTTILYYLNAFFDIITLVIKTTARSLHIQSDVISYQNH